MKPTTVLMNVARWLQRRFGPDPNVIMPDIEELVKHLAGRSVLVQGEIPSINSWGRMEVLDLTSHFGRPPSRSRRPRRGYLGAFRYPHRASAISSDGRAWAKRRPTSWVSAGSLLVDCSGSMKLSLDVVIRLLDKVPALTVATYASLPDDSNAGRLVVLARNGRVADQDASTVGILGSGNIIDGPALNWLGREAVPRIWISDGFVTGVNDQTAQNLVAEASEITRKFNIRRAGTVEECVSQLAASDGKTFRRRTL